jgi:hypothetical protein
MSMILKPVVVGLVRIILFVFGLVAFALSFFHGPDLNLMLFVGISMFVVAASPHATLDGKFIIWGLSASTIACILYAYFVATMFQVSLQNKSAELSDILLVIPLICLVYLILYFAGALLKFRKNIEK